MNRPRSEDVAKTPDSARPDPKPQTPTERTPPVFTVTIDTANAAFRGDDADLGIELVRCLHRLCGDVATVPNGLDLKPAETFRIRDTNGNTVGLATWTADDLTPAQHSA